MSTATLESDLALEEPDWDSADDGYWAAEVEACSCDPAYLIDRYAKIDRPKSAAAADYVEPDLDEIGATDDGRGDDRGNNFGCGR